MKGNLVKKPSLNDSTLENVELGFDEDQSQKQRKFNNINQTMEESFEKSYKPGQSFADDSYSHILDKDDDNSNDHRAYTIIFRTHESLLKTQKSRRNYDP